MFNWEKIGIIYDPTIEKNKPTWRWAYAQGQNAIVMEEFVRVYFCSRERPDSDGKTISRVGYVDLEKGNLKKIIRISPVPVLELGDLGTFDEFGQYPFCPIEKGDAILGYYGGITRCESVPFNGAIGIALSNDGGNIFNKIGQGPVLSYSLDEPFCVGSPKVRFFENRFIMTYSAGVKWEKIDGRAEVCYKLRMAFSNDGIKWSKLNKPIISDRLGKDESQASGDIIFKNGVYHMFFCYRGNYDFRRNKNNSYRIGYAYSKDLINWNRCDEKIGFDVSQDPSDWDYEMVAYPNLIEINGEIYMLYLGNEVGKNGFGAAKLVGGLHEVD